MLVRLEPEGVESLKQFLKNFNYKRSKDNTAMIFPDGEIVHVDDHSDVIFEIEDWWKNNQQWQSDFAPEIELIRIGVHEDFITGGGCILYASAERPFSSTVTKAIEDEILARPYITDISVEFVDVKTEKRVHKLAAKRFEDKFIGLLKNYKPEIHLDDFMI